MKLISFLFLVIIPVLIFGQEINPDLYQKTWLDNETRHFNGYAVTKIFGQMPHAPSAYNFMPITSVAYKSLKELKEDLKIQADKNEWSKAELETKLLNLEQNAQGGLIEIYISRYDENKANFRWFFVIIRGEDDKGKLWEEEIGYQAPEVPYERGYWNYTTMQIPIELKPPFYIYLNDKQSPWLSDFKFLIENMPEGVEQSAQ